MLLARCLKGLDRVAGLLAILSGAAAVFLVGLTVVAVVWRYLLGDPIFGVGDLSRMTLAVVVAGAIAYGARRGAHVHVDVLQMVGGRRVTRYTDVPVRLIGIAVTLTAAYALYEASLCGFACGEFTDNLGIIHTPFYRLLAAGMALYGLILLCELLAGLAQFRCERDPNEQA